VHLTVRVIFEDPGVQELIVKLYHKGKAMFRFIILYTVNLTT
jgi:hypothetical protein